MSYKGDIKIGILTWHDSTNYGSALQAYALHYYLCSHGIDATIIHYIPKWLRGDYMQMPWSTITFRQKFKRLLKNGMIPLYYLFPHYLKKVINPFFPFYYYQCRMTSACIEGSLNQTCKNFSTIIVGSDQIWNPNALDTIFLLPNISNNVDKISYAASIGSKEIPEKMIRLYKDSLKSFKSISVREEEGHNLLKSMGLLSEVHIDPTMLLNATHYRSLEKKVTSIRRPFAFCYFLSSDREYKVQIQKYIQANNIEAIGISANIEDYKWMKEITQVGPQEWLWLVDNADVVFTNSYHATIFSLIFHKPFFTFVRFRQNDPICQNSRLEQLDRYFDIADYYVEGDIPDISPYLFSKFDEKLIVLRHKAEEYLLTHIEKTKKLK